MLLLIEDGVTTILYKHIEESLEGGVTFLQLREKNLDTDSFLKKLLK